MNFGKHLSFNGRRDGSAVNPGLREGFNVRIGSMHQRPSILWDNALRRYRVICYHLNDIIREGWDVQGRSRRFRKRVRLDRAGGAGRYAVSRAPTTPASYHPRLSYSLNSN